MLTLQQQRKRMYKAGYIFSLISLVAISALIFIFLIMLIISIIILKALIIFPIIFLLVFMALYIMLFINIKRAYEECGTDKEKDHFVLGVVCIFFAPTSAIFILIATSMFHE
ncbi:hypothetical protein [Mesoplasma corruscae]|uniref:Transmembrane protein n=1 Tax=Mesoplasma corruscae TaxID=216874 RepID=A0A2S5RFU8_9MOLU|nr:hypothetical protein [Mesoplasma corruscae]PPE06183.1 hypothetical protein MCORR_v1c04870 [Mesoplasma corruscae]